LAFDAGVRAPEEQDEHFRSLQTLGVDEALDWIRKYTAPYDMQPKQWRRRIAASGHILRWMLRFAGDTWDERWLNSGLDQAPRDGLNELAARLSQRPVFLSTGVTTCPESTPRNTSLGNCSWHLDL
jgi:hypothetical protein